MSELLEYGNTVTVNGKSGAWLVFGEVDTEPCAMFFSERCYAENYIKDVTAATVRHNLAAMRVGGVDYKSIVTGDVHVLGWVQQMVKA